MLARAYVSVCTCVLEAELGFTHYGFVHCYYWLLTALHFHLSLNREGRCDTTDLFITSFLQFLCSPLPFGTCRTPGLSILWCYLPTSSSVCLVFFPLSLCLARWFGPTRWLEDMITLLQFASLYDGLVFPWFDYLLDLFTDVLVGNKVFVWDAYYLAVAPHFRGLHSSFKLDCEGSWFTSILGDWSD